MRTSVRTNRIVSFTLLFASLLAGPAHSQEIDCNEDIGAAASRLRGVYQAQLGRCIKEGNFGNCDMESSSVLEGQQEARNRITNPSGSCVEAIGNGVPFSDLGPGGSCPPAGEQCDESIGTIDNVDDLAECVVCLQAGFDTKLRLQLDLPLVTPVVVNERKCIRAVATRSLKAIRTGIREVERCASGGTVPFACPAFDDPDSKFGKALARVGVAVGRCKDAAGVTGQLGGDSALLCRHAAREPDDLSTCAQAAARCLVCSHANGVYQQYQDCAAYSGLACTDTTAAAGTVYVANEGSDSVTFFSGTREPLYGTLGASTFPVGDAPSAVAANSELNIVYVASRTTDAVTFLDATTGQPLYGSLPASTFPAGDSPEALAVDVDSDILYVANRGSDSVTLLNALTGQPYNGGVPESTLAVGDEPRALVHSLVEGIVYVANFGSDSITLLDADTGTYRNGTLPASTEAAGDGPIAISDPDHDAYLPNLVHVVNYNDSTVTYLDAQTLEPRLGMLTIEDSSLPVGTGPRSVTIGPRFLWLSTHQLLVTSEDGTVTVLKSNTSRFGQYVQALRTNATFPLALTPSAVAYEPSTDTTFVAHGSLDQLSALDRMLDVELSRFPVPEDGCIKMNLALDAPDNRLYVSCNEGVTVFDATTGAFAFGSEANSVFPVSGLVRSMTLDPASDLLYVGGYSVAGGDDGLTVISAITGVPAPPFAVPTGTAPWDLQHSPVLDLLYGAHYSIADEEPFFILDADTGATIASLDNDVREPLVVNESEGIVYGRVGYASAAVRFLDAGDGTPLFGTPENSTFASGSGYVEDLALDESAGLLYVPSRYQEVVRVLDAATGAWAFGTEAASTFDTEVPAASIAVEPSTSTLYVSSGGKIVMLDSLTGAPANGSLASSALDAIDVGPLAVNPAADRLYAGAADFGDLSVTFYRLSTGAYLDSELPTETIASGDAPSAIAVME